jgi:hypothetical protein
MDDIETKPSRTLPIGVAAGLAVAVFGVLFALQGSGASTATTVATAEAGETPAVTTDTPVAAADKPVADKPAEAVAADKPAEGDKPVEADKPVEEDKPAEGDKPAEDTAAAATGAPAKTVAVLTIKVAPSDARADIKVNGKDILGERVEMPAGEDPIKVEVKARGYEPFEQEIVPNQDQTVAVELTKEGAAPATTAAKNPTKPAEATKPAETTKQPAPRKPRRPSRPRVDL